VEPFKDPESTVELQIVALGKLASPRIVNDHRRAELRRLDNCLNLATVLGPLSISFRKEEINRALFVAVATLEESVATEDGLQARFCRFAFEEFLPDSSGHEHD
jgi:hypothetical protein